MAKKKTTTMPMMTPTIAPYEGIVRNDFLNAARQSSSFLNERTDNYKDEMMKDMLKADLIATGNHAINHTIGGRAIAARIRDEGSRIFGEDQVSTWF